MKSKTQPCEGGKEQTASLQEVIFLSLTAATAPCIPKAPSHSFGVHIASSMFPESSHSLLLHHSLKCVPFDFTFTFVLSSSAHWKKKISSGLSGFQGQMVITCWLMCPSLRELGVTDPLHSGGCRLTQAQTVKRAREMKADNILLFSLLFLLRGRHQKTPKQASFLPQEGSAVILRAGNSEQEHAVTSGFSVP